MTGVSKIEQFGLREDIPIYQDHYKTNKIHHHIILQLNNEPINKCLKPKDPLHGYFGNRV